MNKVFIEDEDLVKIADKVIEERKLDYLNCLNIRYVLVSPYISKSVVGKCIKPNHELKYFGGFDYLVEFSEDVWNGLTNELKEIVMYHELLHIHITINKKGEEIYKIIDHNVKDFSSIIKKYGIEWFDNLKTIACSVRDLDVGDIDKIKV